MAKENLSAAAQAAQDYLQERIREEDDKFNALYAAEQLERHVKARLNCDQRNGMQKHSIDLWATRDHIEYGLNLDEYKRRCRIRKLYCAPIEAVREDLEVFDRLGSRGYVDYHDDLRARKVSGRIHELNFWWRK